MLRYARTELEWIRADPMADIRRPGGHRARDRRVSDDELERMRLALGWVADVPPANASQRIAVMMLVAVETAMRSGDLCSLTWDQVQAKFVRLDKTKNGDAREVPLSRRARALLDLLPRDGATVFGVSDALRDALWRKARARAEIVGMTFHDLRHEAVTRLARKLSGRAIDLVSLQWFRVFAPDAAPCRLHIRRQRHPLMTEPVVTAAVAP